MNSRRAFIKSSCIACAQFAGLTVLLSGLQSCSSIRILNLAASGGTVSVPLESFEPGEEMKIVRVPERVHDILLVRKPGAAPRALLLQCTHEDARLIATDTGLHCNLHGSTFDLSGEVTNGPAIRRLRQFPVSEQPGQLVIQLS